MSTSDAIQLFVLFLLLCLSGFFSSAETALTTVSRIRIHTLSQEGDPRAAIVSDVISQPEKMLSAILIGNNIVNLSASSLATTLALDLFGSGAVAVATGILTFLVLIFGEITPKTLAAQNSERLSLAYAGAIRILMILMTPLIFLTNKAAGFLFRILHKETELPETVLTQQDLRTLMDESRDDGVLENAEHKMISNVFDLGVSLARDIMVPRSEMVCICVTDSYWPIRELFREERLTRLPVWNQEKNDIVGILNIKDFMFVDQPDSFHVEDLMYEPYFTYEYKKTSELLKEMRLGSIPLTIVLDEYGSVTGMLTLEDLLEELVGEIRDEYDQDEEDRIRQISPDEYLIEGNVKLDDINEELGTDFASDDYDSIAGYILGLLDHLPEEGEQAVCPSGDLLTVQKIDKNRIDQVLLKMVPSENRSGAIVRTTS